MQMVINLAPVSLSNKKVNFYTRPSIHRHHKHTNVKYLNRYGNPMQLEVFLAGNRMVTRTFKVMLHGTIRNDDF